jgi:hypothetical protein
MADRTTPGAELAPRCNAFGAFDVSLTLRAHLPRLAHDLDPEQDFGRQETAGGTERECLPLQRIDLALDFRDAALAGLQRHRVIRHPLDLS